MATTTSTYPLRRRLLSAAAGFSFRRCAAALFACAAATVAHAFGSLVTSTTNPNVIQHPHVYVVFWGFNATNDPHNVQPYVLNFFKAIGGTMWNGVPTQYPGYVPPLSGAQPNTTPQVSPSNDSGIFQGSIGLNDIPLPVDVLGATDWDPVTNTTVVPVVLDQDPTHPGVEIFDFNIRSDYIAYAARLGLIRMEQNLGIDIEDDPNAIIVVCTPSMNHVPPYFSEHSNFNVEDNSTFSTPVIDLPYPANTAVTWDKMPNPTETWIRSLASVALHHELLETTVNPRPIFSIDYPIRGLSQVEGYWGWDFEVGDNDPPPNISGPELADVETYGPWYRWKQVKLLDDSSAVNGDPATTIFTISPVWSNKLGRAVNQRTGSWPQPNTAGLNGSAAWADTPIEHKFLTSATGTLLYSDASGVWQDWGNPGTALSTVQASDTPAAAVQGLGRIDVFVSLSNGHLGHAWTNDANDATPQHFWEDLGGPPETSFFRNPAVTTWGPNQFDIFAVTQDPNSSSRGLNLWQRRFDNQHGGWGGWVKWGHPSQGISSGPSAIVAMHNDMPTIYVYFASGTAPNAGLSRVSLTAWNPPSAGGGAVPVWEPAIFPPSGGFTLNNNYYPVAVGETTPFVQNVFLVSNNKELVECQLDALTTPGQTVDTWTDLGFAANALYVTPSIGAISYGTQEFKILTRTNDNKVWRLDLVSGVKTWTGLGAVPNASTGGINFTTW